MSESIRWSLNVQVTGGPKSTLGRTIDVHAYDKISVEIPAGTSGTDPGSRNVEIQPAEEIGRLRLLLITTNQYDVAVSVTAEGGTIGIPLDGPLLLFSQGAIGLLGESPPQSLTFNNGLETPVKIDILVGRNVTEEGS